MITRDIKILCKSIKAYEIEEDKTMICNGSVLILKTIVKDLLKKNKKLKKKIKKLEEPIMVVNECKHNSEHFITDMI